MTNKKAKGSEHFNQCIWENPTFISDICQQNGNGRQLFKLLKGKHDNYIANVMFNDERQNSFPHDQEKDKNV
jgi:hypothetical protein